MHMLPEVWSMEEITALHEAALRCKAYNSDEPDTVDKEATFQANIFEDGVASAVQPQIARLLTPILEERLLPYVRRKFGCPNACVADALLRRYRAGERTSLNLHYDVQAFATAIIPISAQLDELDGATGPDAAGSDPGRAADMTASLPSAPALTSYTGGLFVQGGPSRASRRFVRFASPGDALIHQFDLMHGVEVRGGTRYAIAVWFSDSPASLAKGVAPWVRAMAERGNADAQFLMASFCAQGRFGTKRDEEAAADWLERGAAQGLAVSVLGLGRHRLGQGLHEEAVSAGRLRTGHVEAQYCWRCAIWTGWEGESVSSAKEWSARPPHRAARPARRRHSSSRRWQTLRTRRIEERSCSILCTNVRPATISCRLSTGTAHESRLQVHCSRDRRGGLGRMLRKCSNDAVHSVRNGKR